jgi:dienelactone hydrolase
LAEVVLFHHVQGLTEGIGAFADHLRAGGHIVHTPDLFDGERPATIEDGVALTSRIGDETLTKRADAAVADLPPGLVYAGFSFGAATAQRLAQTRPRRSWSLALRVVHPHHR